MFEVQSQQQIALLAEKYAVERVEIRVFDRLDSTNKKLWQLIDRGIQTPLAISALQQTAGKGQWGKTWQSGLGGLYLSVALRCDLALENSFHLIMSTATGIASILRDYGLPVTLKWSNDLILNYRKLGGIKIETKTENNYIKYAVVGVGINWHNSVPKIGINLASYYQNDLEPKIKIDSLAQLNAIATIGILKGYSDYLQLGATHTLKQYQQLLNSIGQKITINNYTGIVTGVNLQGQLKVRLQASGSSTEVYLSPGEISLGYDLRST